MPDADDLDVFFLAAEELANGFSLGLDGAGGGFLNEDVAVLAVFEGKEDQVDSLFKAHDEAGHGRLRQGDGLSGADLVDPQGDDAAAGAHDVAVAGAADAGVQGVAALGNGNLLLQGLADAHRVDGIGGLVCRQANHALHPGVDSRIQHIVRADDIGLHGLHREELAARHLLQRRRMEDIINPANRGLERRLAPHVADIELDLMGDLRILHLTLVPHIILLLLIPRKDANLTDIGTNKTFQHCIPK